MCKLSVHHAAASDHEPIFLDLISTSFSRKVFRFRFENTWLRESNFRKEVTDFWIQLPAINLMPKLISVSSFMARWGRNFFHKFRDKLKKQKEVLAALVERTDTAGVEQYFTEKSKLHELMFHEETYWKQRAKNFWLAEGDANTKFFHASALARKKTNHIACLENNQGDQVHEHDAMCRIVKEYFTEVFSNTRAGNATLNLVSERRVTSEQNAKLVADVTYEEFTCAAKQMHPDKACGPDGLNPTFFQQFWHVLG